MPDKKTITFDEGVGGWTSFHSYTPEWMTRVGTKFYTFKNGDLYEHDNGSRTKFYGGSTAGCTITLSVNESPSDVKLFKSLILETTDGNWTADLYTDMESGTINENNLEEYESYYSAYIRQSGSNLNFNELSIIGVGALEEVVTTTRFRVANDVSTQILTSGTDSLYFNDGQTKLVGTVNNILDNDETDSLTRDVIQVSSAPDGVSTFTPGVGNFMFVGKQISPESRGIRGYYCSITLTSGSTGVTELFSVGTEAVKSYL
tara:strand:- start:1468 stop:2247 length:780 start_codon:yes stop_codon:yes gene_type:complete